MKTTSRFAAAAFGALVLAAPPSHAQPGETPAAAAPAAAAPAARTPAETFTGRIEVTAVEIMIEVRDAAGRLPANLAAADFEVLEDGVPVTVIGLDVPPPPRSRSPRPIPEPPRSGDQAWRFVVYFESALTDPRTVKQAARALFQQAPELTSLGSVEVVVADPSPRLVLPFTRDPEQLQEALHGLTRPRRTAGALAKIRYDFLAFRNLREDREGMETIGQIRAAVQQEHFLIERQLERFRRWLDGYGNLPASALILVSDGFDLDPGEFYLQATSSPGIEQRMTTELLRYRIDEVAEIVSRELSARGWTGIVLAPRGVPPPDAAADASLSGRDRYRSIGESGGAGPGSASPVSLLQRPTEPLLLLAEESGGEILTNLKKTVPALERLGQRLRLTYQVDRPADGRRHRLEVRLRRPDVELRAPRWTSSPTAAQIGRSRARRLLALDQAAGDIPVEVRLELAAERRDDGARRARLTVLFDLDELSPVLAGPRLPIRFTFGVALAGAPPFVHQVTEEITLPEPTGQPGRLPRFDYAVDLDLPPESGRIAVVVEEPASGSWGGNVAQQPPGETDR